MDLLFPISKMAPRNFSQSGVELKIQDGGADTSLAMLEKRPPAATEDLGLVSRISMATQPLPIQQPIEF